MELWLNSGKKIWVSRTAIWIEGRSCGVHITWMVGQYEPRSCVDKRPGVWRIPHLEGGSGLLRRGYVAGGLTWIEGLGPSAQLKTRSKCRRRRMEHISQQPKNKNKNKNIYLSSFRHTSEFLRQHELKS
jgi:hypothetical protein